MRVPQVMGRFAELEQVTQTLKFIFTACGVQMSIKPSSENILDGDEKDVSLCVRVRALWRPRASASRGPPACAGPCPCVGSHDEVHEGASRAPVTDRSWALRGLRGASTRRPNASDVLLSPFRPIFWADWRALSLMMTMMTRRMTQAPRCRPRMRCFGGFSSRRPDTRG